MKPALRLAAAAAVALTLAACGDAKLDVTDAQHFTTSIQRMYDSVQGTERDDFLKYFFIAMNGRSDLITMSVLSGDEIARLDGFFNVLASRKRPEELAALSGLTVGQLVDLGRGLKITYLEGRLQEIQRETDLLRDSASFYSAYTEQRGRVEVTPAAVAEPARGPSGTTGEVTVTVSVRNGSDLDVVDLQRTGSGSPWQMEISLGESRTAVSLSGEGFRLPEGGQAFPRPGVPAGAEMELALRADVSAMGWPYPPETPLKALFPEGLEPCLEGWERVFEAEDSFRRVMELERQHALLTRELSETRV